MVDWTTKCTESQVESLCDALEALGALSVSVEDALAATELEAAMFGEPDMPAPAAGWASSVVTALFESQASAELARAACLSRGDSPPLVDMAIKTVPEQDWVRLTQSQFEPIEITPDFWIVPTWHEPPDQAKLFLRLDPGLAFGTGTHPTTRMCLQWLSSSTYRNQLSQHASSQSNDGMRVLDYGCGSGVLAMAAGLWAKHHGHAVSIDAVDLDPSAVESSRINAESNAVAMQTGLPETANGHYTVVLANILATPLKVLAPLLCSHVKLDGHLILAGILSRQVDELKAAYEPWVALDVTDEQEGWVLMTAKRLRP